MNNDDYLIKDYSKSDTPVVTVVPGDAIWKVIDEAKTSGRKIAIYRVGPCILDWS